MKYGIATIVCLSSIFWQSFLYADEAVSHFRPETVSSLDVHRACGGSTRLSAADGNGITKFRYLILQKFGPPYYQIVEDAALGFADFEGGEDASPTHATNNYNGEEIRNCSARIGSGSRKAGAITITSVFADEVNVSRGDFGLRFGSNLATFRVETLDNGQLNSRHGEYRMFGKFGYTRIQSEIKGLGVGREETNCDRCYRFYKKVRPRAIEVFHEIRRVAGVEKKIPIFVVHRQRVVVATDSKKVLEKVKQYMSVGVYTRYQYIGSSKSKIRKEGQEVHLHHPNENFGCKIFMEKPDWKNLIDDPKNKDPNIRGRFMYRFLYVDCENKRRLYYKASKASGYSTNNAGEKFPRGWHVTNDNRAHGKLFHDRDVYSFEMEWRNRGLVHYAVPLRKGERW